MLVYLSWQNPPSVDAVIGMEVLIPAQGTNLNHIAVSILTPV